MIFNSLAFASFFILFFFLYWFVFNRSVKIQNLFLLAACYIFYAWHNWHLLILLLLSTVVTYLLGFAIHNAPTHKIKNQWLYTGLVIFVGLLLYFKYTNFFLQSFASLTQKPFTPLDIILPLGISFYTFRLLSYLFDIKNGKFKPVDDWVVFFSYVSFFPSVISGPIDRPKTLVPQLEQPRKFNHDQAVDGLRQILWGLLKKTVVADNCAVLSNYAFDTPNLHGPVLIAGAFFYTIQIYADFSGYSDMAIGVAKLMGFNITRNFNYPYFSQNVAEFWRKWHISLTSWLTDYIFTPASLQFRDYANWGLIIAIILTFLTSGLWHGANWTFVLWGFLHGCYYIPLILKGKMNKKKEIPADRVWPTFTELRNIAATFILVMFTFVLFRSADISSAFAYYRNIFVFTPSAASKPISFYGISIVFSAAMFMMEWLSRGKQHPLEGLNLKWPQVARWSFYILAVALIMTFTRHEQQFIYFKF